MIVIQEEFIGNHRRTRCNNCYKDCDNAKGVIVGGFVINLCLNCRKELNKILIDELEEYKDGK